MNKLITACSAASFEVVKASCLLSVTRKQSCHEALHVKQMKTVTYNENVLLLNRNRQGSVVTLWCVKLRNESKAGCIFCEA